jgi:putative ABC transport system substrate-binding protein
VTRCHLRHLRHFRQRRLTLVLAGAAPLGAWLLPRRALAQAAQAAQGGGAAQNAQGGAASQNAQTLQNRPGTAAALGVAGAVPRLGVLYPGSAPAEPGGALDAFRSALRELGHAEGRSIALEVHFDDHQPARSAEQAALLVRRGVDIIVAGTGPSAVLARRATANIPIVMAVSGDPVGMGLVASLAQPGGNVTGLSIMSPEISGRRLQLLAEAVPRLSRVALLLDESTSRWPDELRETEAAAQALGLQLLPLRVRGPDDYAGAIETARRGQAQALVLMQSPQFVMQRARLAALALAARLPAVSGTGDRQFAQAGGLMTFGASITASWQRAASYVDRILKGARPSELPVEQASRFELVVNTRTAQLLGLTLPSDLLVLASEVVR